MKVRTREEVINNCSGQSYSRERCGRCLRKGFIFVYSRNRYRRQMQNLWSASLDSSEGTGAAVG
jgi:hypothetical protein